MSGVMNWLKDAGKATATIAFMPEKVLFEAVGAIPPGTDPFGGEKVLGINKSARAQRKLNNAVIHKSHEISNRRN
jgi:hypothetical protein|tara:strand:- start:849 stop:1073 length:225 start_codon:yes stop_codon:yes gene_type:complete